MTTKPISGKFTPLHHQIDDRIPVAIGAFSELLEDGGLEAIINASGRRPEGGEGFLATPGVIDGQPVEFVSYAYLSAVGILNVWSEAHDVRDDERRPLAHCRLGWTTTDPGADPEHVRLADLLRRVKRHHDKT